jgi:hypothetical protein
MRCGSWVRVVIIAWGACVSAGVAGADLGHEEYCLPLVPPYALLRVDRRAEGDGWGRIGWWR